MHLSLKHISTPYGTIQNPLKLGGGGEKIKGQERGREGSRSGERREQKGKRENKPSYFTRHCTGLLPA